MSMATSSPIPIVDLRLLSQSDVANLAASSTTAFNLDTLSDIVPKLNPSLFNESAGSRKQTYCRLPLSSHHQPPNPNPRPSPNPSLPRRRGRPRLHPLPAPASASAATAPDSPPDDVIGRRENLQIVSCLKNLILARQRKEATTSCDAGVRNAKGDSVDLVALAGKEDIFGEEIRRRTEGLRTEEQILGYMTALDGQWGSRRRRRKVVDAAVFGHGLPAGWKVLLGMKRKEGIVYLHCRRYVSPSGKQFESCKEVSSYILSLNGHQDSERPISFDYSESVSNSNKFAHTSVAGLTHQNHKGKIIASCSFVAPISQISPQYEKLALAEPVNTLECRKCSITFGDKDSHLQHHLTFHQRSAKRRKIGKSLVAGVIVKDGKYECQFCHKTFSEKHRYTGHIGAHIRYQGLGVNAGTTDNSSSLALVPYVPAEVNVLVNKSEEAYALNSVDELQIDSSQHISNIIKDEIEHSPKSARLEVSKTEDCNMAADETKEIFDARTATGITHISSTDVISPAAFDVNSTEHTCSPIMTKEDSASKSVHPVNDYNTARNESTEIVDASNAMGTTPNSCTDCISPSGIDVNSDEHTCSPVVNREDSTSNSVHDPVNVCDMTVDKSEILEETNTQVGKQHDLTDLDTIDLDLVTMDARNTYDNMVGDKSDNNDDTNNEISIEFIDEIGHSCSKEKFVREQVNFSDVTGQESADMSVEANACIDALAPSVINVENVNHDDTNVISAIEDYKGDQRIYAENDLLSLSGNGPRYGVETYGNDIFTSTVEQEQHVDLGPCISEKTNAGNYDDLTNKDMGFMSTMHGELHNSCIIDNIASEPTSGIDTNADCMFAGDMTKSLIEGIDRVGNELQNCFDSSDVCDVGGGSVVMDDRDGREAMQAVGDTSSSWMHSSDSLPILNMISDQSEDQLHSTVPKNEQVNMSGFGELRLGIEPGDFVLFTGQAPESVARSPMEYIPDDQLGWGISLSKMSPMHVHVPTSVCVWCSREFSLEGIESEPQSESLGYMCPDCKAKISRQFLS